MDNIRVLCIEDRYIERYFLLSNKEPFEQYQYFKILDDKNDNPICKVIKPRSIYKLEDIDNLSILRNAKSLGFKENETFYWAEVLIEKELITSINPSSIAIKTTEEETYDYLYNDDINDCLVLGEIRGTENVYEELEQNTYKDKLVMFKNSKVTNQHCLPLVFNYKKLQQIPNIGIFGNSGSGKTFALKTFIEELIIKEIPTIVFDPHNEFDFDDYYPDLPAEFKKDFKSHVTYLTAGKDFGLRFPDLSNEDLKRFIESTRDLSDPQSLAIDELRELTDSFETFRDRIEQTAKAIRNIIESNKKQKPEDISQTEKDLVDKYASKISSSSVLVALSAKLSYYSKRNYFSKNYDEIINSLKDRKTVVIRGEYNIVAPMMGIILNDIWRKRKDFKDGEIDEEYPPVITILDEAHMYAPKDMSIKAPLRRTLIDISREGRKYGMFLICATQRISELHNTVLSQMSTKIILKTSQEADKLIVQKECGLTEAENNKLHLLDSGNGYIVSPILKTKTAIAFQARCNYSKPKITINAFDELKDLEKSKTKDKLEDYLLLQLPLRPAELPKVLNNFKKFAGEKTPRTVKEARDILDSLVIKGIIKSENSVYSSLSDNVEFI